jgi:hypothetical protein
MSQRIDGGPYTQTLAAVNRDILYEVVAGDAVAGPFKVRVMRPPLVREYRIDLTFAPESKRAPVTLHSPDGSFQAPPGTRATITVVATEPLKSAWFTIDGKRIEAALAGDPDARQVQTIVEADASYTVEMISRDGVAGSDPAKKTIRLAPPGSETAPAEFRDALRAYFGAVGQNQPQEKQ